MEDPCPFDLEEIEKEIALLHAKLSTKDAYFSAMANTSPFETPSNSLSLEFLPSSGSKEDIGQNAMGLSQFVESVPSCSSSHTPFQVESDAFEMHVKVTSASRRTKNKLTNTKCKVRTILPKITPRDMVNSQTPTSRTPSITLKTNTSTQSARSNRPRMKWTKALRKCFKEAVDALGGLNEATPKKVLWRMGVKNVSLWQVKSFLQKCRMTEQRKDSNGNQSDHSSEDNVQMDNDDDYNYNNNSNGNIATYSNTSNSYNDTNEVGFVHEEEENRIVEFQSQLISPSSDSEFINLKKKETKKSRFKKVKPYKSEHFENFDKNNKNEKNEKESDLNLLKEVVILQKKVMQKFENIMSEQQNMQIQIEHQHQNLIKILNESGKEFPKPETYSVASYPPSTAGVQSQPIPKPSTALFSSEPILPTGSPKSPLSFHPISQTSTPVIFSSLTKQPLYSLTNLTSLPNSTPIPNPTSLPRPFSAKATPNVPARKSRFLPNRFPNQIPFPLPRSFSESGAVNASAVKSCLFPYENIDHKPIPVPRSTSVPFQNSTLMEAPSSSPLCTVTANPFQTNSPLPIAYPSSVLPAAAPTKSKHRKKNSDSVLFHSNAMEVNGGSPPFDVQHHSCLSFPWNPEFQKIQEDSNLFSLYYASPAAVEATAATVAATVLAKNEKEKQYVKEIATVAVKEVTETVTEIVKTEEKERIRLRAIPIATIEELEAKAITKKEIENAIAETDAKVLKSMAVVAAAAAKEIEQYEEESMAYSLLSNTSIGKRNSKSESRVLDENLQKYSQFIPVSEMEKLEKMQNEWKQIQDRNLIMLENQRKLFDPQFKSNENQNQNEKRKRNIETLSLKQMGDVSMEEDSFIKKNQNQIQDEDEDEDIWRSLMKVVELDESIISNDFIRSGQGEDDDDDDDDNEEGYVNYVDSDIGSDNIMIVDSFNFDQGNFSSFASSPLSTSQADIFGDEYIPSPYDSPRINGLWVEGNQETIGQSQSQTPSGKTLTVVGNNFSSNDVWCEEDEFFTL